jgi:uncharacterized protein (TIGR02466 family)
MTTSFQFSTPIWVSDLEGAELAAVQAEIAGALVNVNPQPTPWDESGTTSFSFEGCNDIQTHKLDLLSKVIFRGLGGMLKDLGYPQGPWNLCDSWFNWYGQGDFMFEHIHPERRVSGCYYYKTTGQDGRLKFKNPNPLMQFKQWPADQLRDQDFQVEPKEGRLVLFPSWLTHRVSVNRTDEERMSIAFNLV